MTRYLQRLSYFVLLLILLMAGAADSATAVELRAIGDVSGIESYRAHSFMRFGEDPPAQHVEVEGKYTNNPEAYEIQVTLTEGSRDPWIYTVRRVDGLLYSGRDGRWTKIEKFDLTELSVVAPEDLLDIGPRLDEVATQELNGRKVLHLRGDKGDLPDIGGSSDSIEFSRTDRATVDLWVDASDRFIVKMQISAEFTRGSDVVGIEFGYEASGFNESIIVEPIGSDSLIVHEPPPMPDQEEVTQTLGFEFELPNAAHVAIYGATVSILTEMPLPEAREHAARSMKAAGFKFLQESETHPGEFHSDYRNGDRKVGVRVFQVSEKGATIQVGAPK